MLLEIKKEIPYSSGDILVDIDGSAFLLASDFDKDGFRKFFLVHLYSGEKYGNIVDYREVKDLIDEHLDGRCSHFSKSDYFLELKKLNK